MLDIDLEPYISTSKTDMSETTGIIIKSTYSSQLIGGNNAYTPRVEYKYIVDNDEYINDRLETDVGDIAFRSKKRVLDFIEEHSVMKEVTVYYNINNPAVSYLYDGIGFGAMFFLVFGLVLIWVAFKIKQQKKI